ncbi:MAG: hypothetical protein IH881_16020 [Myxococcales bacterium]|nr:hypothetical protein [Myxococcales bacterium]
MNNLSLRISYGRGAARLLVPLPELPLETVPPRFGREVVSALAPLYLALLLPLCALMLKMNASLPAAPSIIQLTEYENFDAALPETREITEIAAESPPPMETASKLQPERIADAGPPAPNPQALAPAPTRQALAGIEMDQLEIVRSAPGSATRVRVTSLTEPRRAGLAATDFAPVETDAPPPSLLAAQTTGAVALPAVSLPGPRSASAAIPVESLDGVDALHVSQAIFIPIAPAIPQLAESQSPDALVPSLAEVGNRDADGGFQSQRLDGVPLESLAACRSREREDGLKQELMLVVTSGTRCTGLGGTYSFLETKNLNAFLLRVARDSERDLGNRCDELMRAQVCVEAQRGAGVLQ